MAAPPSPTPPISPPTASPEANLGLPAGHPGPTRAQIQAARAGGHRSHSHSHSHAGPGARRARRSTRVSRRRRLAMTCTVTALVVVLVVVLVERAGRPPTVLHPTAEMATTLPPAPAVPAADVSLPWPAGTQAAVAIPAVGYTADSGSQHSVPIASMTKIMTAYVVLQDHPLQPGKDGPAITISADDAANYAEDTVTDQASVELQAGEVLTERQMLEAMLVHSANDLAYSLGCWDAGSLGAFVAKMNATAAKLGMKDTHYADASGYTAQSMSTPSDLLKVAAADMADPTFAGMVDQPSVTLPVGGTVSSYTPLLPGGPGGVPGVIGIKSGFTSAAGGGDILAYQASAGGQSFVVLAAVTSMEGPTVLDAAGRADLAVAQAAAAHVTMVPVMATGTHVGTVTAAGRTVPMATVATGGLLAWPGQTVRQKLVVTHHPRGGDRSGTPVGAVRFSLGSQQLAVPVRTAGRLPLQVVYHHLF